VLLTTILNTMLCEQVVSPSMTPQHVLLHCVHARSRSSRCTGLAYRRHTATVPAAASEDTGRSRAVADLKRAFVVTRWGWLAGATTRRPAQSSG
jgi:hypothetical protein